MPQKVKYEARHNEGICQDCLDREMGQWFDEEVNPEALNMVKDTFYLDSHGKCTICGRITLYGPVEFEPGQFYDCLAQNLEFDIEEHGLIEENELEMN